MYRDGDEGSVAKAFPEAEGSGAGARGGTGGRIIQVTTLDDDGPGSLREACAATGPRIVEFGVAGNIDLEEPLEVTEPYLTISGDSAPAGGVCLTKSLGIAAEHVIVRHLRIRPGRDGYTPQTPKHCIDIRPPARHVIIDHCSFSWGGDKLVTLYGEGWTDVTVQWCIFSEPYGCQMGTLSRGNADARASFHHNLYAHCKERCPLACSYHRDGEIRDGQLFDFRNNVIFNWGSTHPGYNSDSENDAHCITKTNFINNHYKPGQTTSGGYAFLERTPHNRTYWSGNSMNGRVVANQWELINYAYYYDDRTRIRDFTPEEKAAHWQSEAFAVAPVQTDDARTTFYRVLSEAGAILPKRDAVDQRLFHDAINGWGKLIQHEDEVGGYPDLTL
jgi:pectate lyase